MKKIIICFILLCLILQASLISSCKKQPSKYSSYSFDYFDTVTSIVGYAYSEDEFNKVSERILSELETYHKLFTIYHRYDQLENLCTINEIVNGTHRTVTVDARIIEMLEYAINAYNTTSGKVNVAMGSVLSIWHDYREDGMSDPSSAKLPPLDKLTDASKHTDINNVIINNELNTVTLTDPNMKLDVGAIAKGYAVEMIAKDLEEDGISGYVLNVGGNVRTIGTKGDGEKWVVGIENPDENSEEAYIAYLELAGEALVTSGSYQRYYIVDGEAYHHIIDRETLMPAKGFLSVSIICGNSADGDGLSTALFCMSLEDGMALIESLDGVEAHWVLEDGTRVKSSGFSNFEVEYNP